MFRGKKELGELLSHVFVFEASLENLNEVEMFFKVGTIKEEFDFGFNFKKKMSNFLFGEMNVFFLRRVLRSGGRGELGVEGGEFLMELFKKMKLLFIFKKQPPLLSIF